MLLVDLYEWALAHPELPDPEDAGTWPGVPGSFKTHARHMRERAVPIEARRTAVTAVEAGPWDNVLRRLERRELIVPMLENELAADEWPDQYNIKIDSKKHVPKPGYFHPSVHPLMGARELYYRMHPATRDLMVPERRLAKDHMLLAVHSAAHAIVQTKMEMAKIVRPENIEWSYVDEIHKIRGRIDFIVDSPTAELEFIRAGQLRALAVTSAARFFSLPEVATTAEAGVPGYAFTSWQGLVAPAGLPQPVVSRLNTEVATILAEPTTIERIKLVGNEPSPSSPEAFRARIAADIDKWTKVVDAARIERI